jgi:hypothetical protein
VDINCAHCGEPWDVYGLRHDEEPGTYRKVLSGEGCPSCGYDHPGEGDHREEQLRQLVMDGVTDDDPLLFF